MHNIAELQTLIERLSFHAEAMEDCGHLNAARYMHQAVIALSDVVSAGDPPQVRAPVPPKFLEYLSEVPEGYQTVLGYLAIHHPDVLETVDCTDPEATQRDGFKLSHWCKQEGHGQMYVNAPPVLQERGIRHVRAYPVELLERRWA